MAINDLNVLFPPFAELVYACDKKAGDLGFFTYETYRSFETQLDYYKRGRVKQDGVWVVTKPKDIVTKAKPGYSFHAYGLAVDKVPKSVGINPRLGLQWSWDDYDLKTPGIQKIPWTKLAAIYRAQGILAGNDWKKFPDPPHGEKSYGFKVTDLYTLITTEGLPAVWKKIEGSIPKKHNVASVPIVIPTLPIEIIKPQPVTSLLTQEDVFPKDIGDSLEDVQLGFAGRLWRDAMGGVKR